MADYENFFHVNQGSNYKLFNVLACTCVALLNFHQKTGAMLIGTEKARMSDYKENL